MLNLVISTIVFFVAAWFVNRYLDEQEIPKGLTRGVLVFLLAFFASWVTGAMVDWVSSAEGMPTSA